MVALLENRLFEIGAGVLFSGLCILFLNVHRHVRYGCCSVYEFGFPGVR